MEKKYWKGLEELRNDSAFVRQVNNEFPEELPVQEIFNSRANQTQGTDRRDFLKFLGFGVAAATLASCEAPVRKTIPYLVKPEEIIPGVANWYASTYADGVDYCPVLVKTREGRPIKIEGNPKSSMTKGGTNARAQASVLSLYDSARLKNPLLKGQESNWKAVDEMIGSKLVEIAGAQGKIRIFSSSIVSPSGKKTISDFIAKYPTAKHITWDAVSYSGMIDANKASFGAGMIPSYRFDKASVIVSFGADFLTSWISPVEFTRQYVAGRKLNGTNTMSKHYQFEAALSLAGSNADVRVPMKPSEQSLAILNLYNLLAASAGTGILKDKPVPQGEQLKTAASELWKHKGKALVVCDSNDANTQLVVNAINQMLDSYGNTIQADRPCNLFQGTDSEVQNALKEMASGEVGAAFFLNCNPAYHAARPGEFNAAMAKVGLKVSFSDRADETASMCDAVCPDSHYLESWGDAEPYKNVFSLGQPSIHPLFNTRQAFQSLLNWAGVSSDYHTYIKEYWKANVFPLQKGNSSFESFWSESLQAGVFEPTVEGLPSPNMTPINGTAAAEAIMARPAPGTFELVLYQKTGLGTGTQSNNPWLQELPDPISKVTWDNYLSLSPKFAADNNLVQGSMVSLEANGTSIEIPVLVQPGQAYGTGSVALGYGRTHAGKAGNKVGKNVFPMASVSTQSVWFSATGAMFSKLSSADHEFAATQTHHTMMGRHLVKETTLAEYIKNPKAGNPDELIATHSGPKPGSEVNLWDDHPYPGHKWGMAIDLNSCIGCGNCVVSCQAENNVPVVGKDEVRRSREMHWIRIDRYFTSDMTKTKAKEEGMGLVDSLGEMEHPSENPQVVFQPVMCQQCNHAPCETVCPVAATNHSSEGLNQMAYNRCIGTRYCANNCPYKVRRFNWFKYADNETFDFNMNDSLGKMVLNPDVVVRSRGVMEKCSFCVQRIQEGKLEAKKEKRKLNDGEVKVACAQSCPADAISFGDYNNPDSAVSKAMNHERGYHLLGELNVQPNVVYLTKVRNGDSHHA